jgi:hypothetical protein
VSLRNMIHKEVINFMQEHIVHRYGIPQTLTTYWDKQSEAIYPEHGGWMGKCEGTKNKRGSIYRDSYTWSLQCS